MRRLALFASLSLVPLAGALAADSSPNAAPARNKATTSTHQSGLRVYVDPATGRRTSQPSPDARRAAAATDAQNPAFSHSSDGLVERPLPGGGFIVDLEGRFQSATGVRIGKDGKREFYCDESAHDAASPAAPSAPAREER
jgi:hypothetical protein